MNIPKPLNNTYKFQVSSSNLITGYEILSLASNTFYKSIFNDSTASIQTSLIYKNDINSTGQLTTKEMLAYLDSFSCFLKMIPISLISDMYV